jgi:hypothetical protein
MCFMARADASGGQRFTWRLRIEDAEHPAGTLEVTGEAHDWPELERGLTGAVAEARRRYGEVGDEEDGWELRAPIAPPRPRP